MPEDTVRQRRVEEAHERMRRRLRPERPAPGPAAREERTENDELYVGGPHVSLPRAGGPDGGDEAQRFLDHRNRTGFGVLSYATIWAC